MEIPDNEKFLNEGETQPNTPRLDDMDFENEMFYNCTECPSLIEFLSINFENKIIEFRCLNKNCLGKKEMSIQYFLKKMKNNRNKKINDDKCNIHKNNNYICYCFDCNCHLCKECLIDREHFFHCKNNIIEIEPSNEELKLIEEIIQNYKKELNNLKIQKFNKISELKDKADFSINKENKLYDKIIKKNKYNEEKELKLNIEKYLKDICEINKKYKNDIKLRKYELEKSNIKIINKYKYKNEKEYILFNYKKKEINRNYNTEIKKLEFDRKIKDLEEIKSINEIIFNTYNSYKNNYYNALNVNNILLFYTKNEKINNNIIKKNLKKSLKKMK